MRSLSGETRRSVAFVVTSSTTAHHFVARLAAFLASDRGLDVYVLADSADALAREAYGAVTLVGVPMRRDPSPLADLASVRALVRTLRTIRPDGVVYATPKASLLTSIVSRFLGIPVRIYQAWGLRLETTTGLQRRILTAAERLTAALSTQVTANSRSLADRMKELRLTGSKPITVLGEGSSHGVDTVAFSPTTKLELAGAVDAETRAFLETGSGPVLGFVGRVHPDKGINTLIEALKIMYGRGITTRTLLVGPPEGYRVAEALAVAGLTEHVHVCGRQSPVQPYFAQMDVLVLPSLREGFPNVVLEAAAMGIPAIVSDATGVRDSVVPGETGLLFPTSDAAALAETIEKLVVSPALRESLGARARSHAVEVYSEEVVWSRFADYLMAALERRNI